MKYEDHVGLPTKREAGSQEIRNPVRRVLFGQAPTDQQGEEEEKDDIQSSSDPLREIRKLERNTQGNQESQS